MNHFPAVRLNHKIDGWEYSLNFSSELLVSALVLIVVVGNIIIFNPLKADYTHQDKSLAAALLNNHSGLNNLLNNKQNTISTTVAGNNGLISQASADNAGSVLSAYDTLDFEPTEDGINDNGITKANPDSVQKLLADSVKIHETKAFETVYTVAKDYGLKPETIRDTNGLPNYALKAGWFLVIPPVDGLVIQVNNPNLTLSDVAHAYTTDTKSLVAYNGLEDEEDMVEVGDYLIVPHGRLPAPQSSSTPTTPTPKSSKPYIPRAATIAGNHRFAPGYCTDYVARNVAGVTWGGNAKDWPRNAKAQGRLVDRNPVVGAILVTSENRRYGHVAKIDAVNGSMVTISEWNYAGLYKRTVRTLSIDNPVVKAVIHP